MTTLTAEPEVEVYAETWAAHNASSHIPNAETARVIREARAGINVRGPFATAREAFEDMLREMEKLDDEEDNFCTP